MTGAELYTFLTGTDGPLAGYQIDSTLFYQLLALVQGNIQDARDWMILRKTDTTKTALVTDTYLTSKALPADFNRWQEDDAIVLIDPNNSNDYQYYSEIGLSSKIRYQTDPSKYYCDYANNLLYLCGNVTKTYTINQNYIYKPDDVAAAASWVFPSRFHLILPYDVAIAYAAGHDFDEINKAKAEANKITRATIWDAMTNWDSQLQTNALKGIDRHGPGGRPWLSGHVDMNK